jgi:Family of unknown function (DUF6893)
MKVLGIAGVVLAVLVLVLVGTQRPEIRRYVKMRSM